MPIEEPRITSTENNRTQEWIGRLQKPEIAPYWLAAIIDSAEDAIISKTLDGIITSWNKGAQRIFGYTAEEVIGKPVTILIPPEHPDEEPNILARLRRGERIEHYETVRVRKDGTRINISLTVSPIRGADGTIIGASKIARDITERKRAEEALRRSEQELSDFFEHAVVGLHWVGPDGKILRANRAELEMLGYSPEEYLGHHIAEFHADDVVIKDILARLQRGEVLHEYEARLRCKDGTIKHVLIDSSVLWEGDQFVHTRCFTRDITDKKRAEVEREKLLENERQARREAEEASRLKDEFLAVVSHELRTPLTAILGWVRMLRTGKLDEGTAQKAMDSIDRNVVSQAQLVEDLLDISRIVTGKMNLEMRPLKPSVIINAAVDAIRPTAEAKNIRLLMIIDPSAGPVAGDFERLQQVVWNLLSNAVKFTPRGGHIEIKLEQVDSDVVLSVSDNGKGIPRQFLPHVFERFTQADASSTRVHGGMGVGLSIVKSIVELHGGTVQADSPGENQGATFTVSLPVARVNQNTSDAEANGNRRKGSAAFECPKELAGLRILIVDDEVDTCEMLSASFEQCGSKVRLETSAAGALAQIDEWPPDIIIADINMPEMDGYELIREIRARDPQQGGKIPAVALTAMARIEDRVKALAAGYQMHVAKPVEIDELRTVVASLASVVVKK